MTQHKSPEQTESAAMTPIGVRAQPDPISTPQSEEVTALVIADLEARREHGIATYGTPLKTFNGRDSLVDAYHELLDLVKYMRQLLTEQRRL